MKSLNSEIKKVVDRVKEAQVQFEGLVNSRGWVEEARKYANRQRKEVKKLLTADVDKIKIFLERERKELERFQKQIPGEVKKIRKFVTTQKKEFEKLLTNVGKLNVQFATQKTSRKPKAKKARSTATKKKAASASASASAQSANT